MTPNDRAPKLGKVRKPRTLHTKTGPIAVLGFEQIGPNKGLPYIITRDDCFDETGGVPDADMCRQLAAWLTRAANYLDSKKVRRDR